ncbi:MAG: hypothetical protein WKF36_11210, partial [Candidatus Nitrosocosmicus sp.]
GFLHLKLYDFQSLPLSNDICNGVHNLDIADPYLPFIIGAYEIFVSITKTITTKFLKFLFSSISLF